MQAWRPAPLLVALKGSLSLLQRQFFVSVQLLRQRSLFSTELSTNGQAWFLMMDVYIGNLDIGSVQSNPLLSLPLCSFQKFLLQSTANAHRESELTI